MPQRSMTSKEQLQAFFASAAASAQEIFNAKGEVLPMWHAEPAQGDPMLIVTPWDGDAEKDSIALALRELFKSKGVTHYAFISEVWMAQMGPDDVGDIPRPSNHPNRREALMIQAEDTQGNYVSGFFYILRPEHSHKPRLSPLKINDYDGMTGRFTKMLQPY